jgi:hypothetical protein
MAEETRQQRRARERRDGVVRGTTSATPPAIEKSSIRAWHIAVGIPMGFVAFGLGLTAIAGPAFFLLGITFAYAGIAWLLFDWWFFSKDLALRTRLIGTTGTLVIGLAISWVAFRPAPLDTSFSRIIENYSEGTDIGGIKWKSKYAGFRLFLRNDSEFQYTNINFQIRTDVLIAGIGFITKFSQCAAKANIPGLSIGGVSIGLSDKQGKTSYTPMELTEGDIFKVICDKLLPHDPLEIIVATRQHILESGFPEAAAVTVRGSFDGFGQSRPLAKSECLIIGCTPVIIP